MAPQHTSVLTTKPPPGLAILRTAVRRLDSQDPGIAEAALPVPIRNPCQPKALFQGWMPMWVTISITSHPCCPHSQMLTYGLGRDKQAGNQPFPC